MSKKSTTKLYSHDATITTPKKEVIEKPEDIENDLEEVRKLEKKISSLTEKNLELRRENEKLSYENMRDKDFIKLRKTIITTQKQRIEKKEEESKQTVAVSKEMQKCLTNIRKSNQDLLQKIQDKIDDQFPEEVDESAGKDEKAFYMRKKIRALQIKNKVQKQLMNETIPSTKNRLQLILNALQLRIDAADDRLKQANAQIIKKPDRMIPQKESKIEITNDIADDAELCVARTQIDSMEFETTAEVLKARSIEDETEKLLTDIKKREKELKRKSDKVERKRQERENKENESLNATEAELECGDDGKNAEEEVNEAKEEEEEEEANEKPKFIINNEEIERRKQFKDAWTEKCHEISRLTNEALQVDNLEMKLQYLVVQKAQNEFNVAVAQKELERKKMLQEKSKLLIEKYHNDLESQTKGIEASVNDLVSQIESNNAVLTEARGELAARQKEVEDIENELAEAKQEAVEAKAKTEKA